MISLSQSNLYKVSAIREHDCLLEERELKEAWVRQSKENLHQWPWFTLIRHSICDGGEGGIGKISKWSTSDIIQMCMEACRPLLRHQLMEIYHTVVANKKLTFHVVSMMVSMSIRFVIVLYSMHMYTSIVFTFMQRLIGKHDHTAIIAHSTCLMEEAIFREVASGGEAQRTLRGTCWCNRRPKKAVLFKCVFPLARYILLEKL